MNSQCFIWHADWDQRQMKASFLAGSQKVMGSSPLSSTFKRLEPTRFKAFFFCGEDGQQTASQPAERVRMMEKATYLYFRMATWFACHEPGTPVPEWCFLSWPLRDDSIQELIELYEAEHGRPVDSSEYDDWGTSPDSNPS